MRMKRILSVLCVVQSGSVRIFDLKCVQIFLSCKTLDMHVWLWLLFFISVETGALVLAFMIYFSMPKTNHSATAYARVITENIQNRNVLCCILHNHEVAFVKCQSAW